MGLHGPQGKVQSPFQGMESGSKLVNKGHSGIELEEGRLRMEKLFRKRLGRGGGDSQGSHDVVGQDHGRVLGKMLHQEIFPLSKTTHPFESSERDERAQQSPTNPSRTLPAPE